MMRPIGADGRSPYASRHYPKMLNAGINRS
jgi:hypothetical protein